MRITPAGLDGCWLIDPEPVSDARGSFARLICADRFADYGMTHEFPEVSQSVNTLKGTLRGIHLQRPPHGEAKLVRATAGAIHDVILDLRAGPGFGRHVAVELTATNGRLLYIAEGVAHGFQTLCDGATVEYHISTPYVPEAQDGVRWSDPTLGIDWPDIEHAISSDRDRNLPLLAEFRPC